MRSLPEHLSDSLKLCATPESALKDAAALVVATEWPDYQNVNADVIFGAMRAPTVLDAGSFLKKALGADPRIRYVTVGKALG